MSEVISGAREPDAPLPDAPPRSLRSPQSLRPSAGPEPARRGLRALLPREPNAIWMREMRQSARLARTPWVLFSLVVSLALLLAAIGGIAAASDASPATLGQALFQVFFSLSFFVVSLVGPAIAANGIASEREGRTWEAVLLTGMTPLAIARGKFLAAYTTIALYIVALAPIGALPFLFGGVTAEEVVVSFVLLFVFAAVAVAFGLAVSSQMASLRGAIVVTLMLAMTLSPVIYTVGGVLGSVAVHRLWSDIPEAFPVWLPLAYVRAHFGLTYVALLGVLPLLAVTVPTWFLYESTVANLTGESDDRSTGLKRWFAVTAPALALAAAVPSLLATDDEGRALWGCGGVAAFAFHATLAAMLFASEPPGPSRRVTVQWERARAGVVRRFFGPGLVKTSALVIVVGLVGVIAVAAIDGGALMMFGSARRARYLEELAAFTEYLAGFGVFAAGLVAWARSRSASPWVARILAAGVLFLISAAPWVAAAVAGVFSHPSERWLAIAAPSPFFSIAMIAAIDGSQPDAAVLVESGLACAAFWALAGFALYAAAARRCARILNERADATRRTDEALDREEREAAATRASAPS